MDYDGRQVKQCQKLGKSGRKILYSVANPECLSRIQIFIHPGSIPLTTTKEEGGKKNLLFNLFCVVATNFTKFKTILMSEQAKKTI
jgi:hypothetical protein